MIIKRIFRGSILAMVMLLMITTLAASHAPRAEALGSGFTYQGQLNSGGEPFTGSCDFTFGLWDSLSEGAQVGVSQAKEAIGVEQGLFTVLLDFGTGVFSGEARWLEIALRCPAGSGDYTTLVPRQPLTAAPYASYAQAAPWTGISGMPGDFADGVDNDTTYSAGTGLSLDDTTLNVTGAPWAGLTGVPAGFADGIDNDTTYIAGTGLTLTGTTFLPDTDVLQARVSSACDGESAIGAVNADGSVTCQPFWTLTGNVVDSDGILGTTTDFPLNFIVNGVRALRLEPHATSPNLIGGYSGNTVSVGVYGATISGGGNSGNSNSIEANYGTIGGGNHNVADGNASTVGGGYNNNASGLSSTVGGGASSVASGDNSTVGGGLINTASGSYSTVGGGYDNTASAGDATVGGGNHNVADGNGSTVGGGDNNSASGLYSTVPGGYNNKAIGESSFAAGSNAEASKSGCFVWGDYGSTSTIKCEFINQWVARARGGVYFYTNNALTSGLYLAADGSSWNSVSARELKENFTPVDTTELLERLSQIEISTWNYKAQEESIIHVGPMANEFNALVDGLGGEGQDFINTMDANGIALAAIQGLIAENQDLKAQVSTLEQDYESLEARLAKLEEKAGSGSAAQWGAGLSLPGVLVAGVIACSGIWVYNRRQGGGGL